LIGELFGKAPTEPMAKVTVDDTTIIGLEPIYSNW
jgi:hypothetical protein